MLVNVKLNQENEDVISMLYPFRDKLNLKWHCQNNWHCIVLHIVLYCINFVKKLLCVQERR